MSLVIQWSKDAIKKFDAAIAYIENDSPANAEKFKKEILLSIESLLNYPERYSPDKFKLNNDGSYRAFGYIITEFHTDTRMIAYAFKNQAYQNEFYYILRTCVKAQLIIQPMNGLRRNEVAMKYKSRYQKTTAKPQQAQLSLRGIDNNILFSRC